MIVKNEEHVIERSLDSALPFVDSWCIVDTGSTDQTIQKIHEIAKKHGKPGILHERPWVNFGHNRTELLELARATPAEWFFMMDADDILMCNEAFADKLQPFDTYTITFHRGSLTYRRPAIFAAKSPWTFKGALHEYAHLDTERQATFGKLDIWVDARVEGARSKNPNKYRDDALSLESHFQRSPDSRTAFYCAQSWRDANESEKAIQWYLTRTTMGGWNQEIYVSYLNLVRLSHELEAKFKYAWASLEICPRLEAVHSVLEYTRKLSLWSKQAFALGEACAELQDTPTKDKDQDLFAEHVEPQFYDELSIHSFYTNHHKEAVLYGMKAYSLSPEDQRERILKNLSFAKI